MLDVLGVVLLALMLRSMLGEGYRISFAPDFRLSLRSWPRIAVWLGVLLALRHLAWRVVPWHTRVAGWCRSAWTWEPLRAAWPPYIVSRLMVLAVGYVAVVTLDESLRRPAVLAQNELLNLFARFDAGWYFGIASEGYTPRPRFDPTRQSEIAFFPGLPILMRATGVLLDFNFWVAGIVVVTVAFLWALTYVYRLACLDLDPTQARAALAFLAFYPFAVCYSAILTEALFLLAAAATFYHFRRAEYWKAGAFGLFVGLLRPNGFLVAVPLGLMALLPFARSRGLLPGTPNAEPQGWPRLAVQLGVASLPVVGMLTYAAHVWTLTGDPFAFVAAQQAWGRRTAVLLAVIADRADVIANQGFAAYARVNAIEMLETSAALLALGAVWPIVRRFGLAYGVFVATAVIPPFISMGSISLGRYTAPLFPIFLWLGATVPAERRSYWLAVFAAGQALVATLFYTWRAPY